MINIKEVLGNDIEILRQEYHYRLVTDSKRNWYYVVCGNGGILGVYKDYQNGVVGLNLRAMHFEDLFNTQPYFS